MDLYGMLWQQKLLLGAFILAATAASQPDSSCSKTCGNVSIPYPFGISEGCYLDPSFQITCNYSSSGTPTPLLGSNTSNIHVLDISLLDGEVRVLNFIARDCYNESGLPVRGISSKLTLADFFISYTRNMFTVVGCDTFALIYGSGVQNYSGVLGAHCDHIDSVVNGSCSGSGCSQTSIPKGISSLDLISVFSFNNHSAVRSFNPCGFAFVVEAEAYNFSSSDLQQLESTESVPLVIDWAVGNETCEAAQKNMTSYACKAEDSYCYNSTNGLGYRCNCSTGFQGNPYLPDGCNFPTALYAKTKFGIKNHRRIHTCAVNSILPKIQLGMFPGKIGGVTPVSLKTQSFLDRTYTCTFSTINTHKYTHKITRQEIYTWFGQHCLHPQSTPDIFTISQE
jgi:hypothetical protein